MGKSPPWKSVGVVLRSTISLSTNSSPAPEEKAHAGVSGEHGQGKGGGAGGNAYSQAERWAALVLYDMRKGGRPGVHSVYDNEW